MLTNFKETQPVAYRMLKNSLQSEKTSHAYLLAGDKSSNKSEIAILLAQSIVCETKVDGYGCGKCNTCLRIENGQYADFIYIDGKKETIKKEEIIDIQKAFSTTTLEKYGKKIYLIDGCENASIAALNSLLKFLEEPIGDVTAILCVDQIDRLLPTIISRCQIIPLKKNNHNQLYEEAITKLVDKLDAHILSQMLNKVDEVIDVSATEEYQNALSLWFGFVEVLSNNPKDALFYLQTEGFNPKRKEKNREVLELFLNIGIIFCQDKLNLREVDSIKWKECLHRFDTDVARLTEIQAALLACRDDLLRNVNILLTVDKLGYLLIKEG
jgi:DNA polymerase III, gamma/tau subunits